MHRKFSRICWALRNLYSCVNLLVPGRCSLSAWDKFGVVKWWSKYCMKLELFSMCSIARITISASIVFLKTRGEGGAEKETLFYRLGYT